MTIVTKLPSEAEKKKEAEANEVPLVQVFKSHPVVIVVGLLSLVHLVGLAIFRPEPPTPPEPGFSKEFFSNLTALGSSVGMTTTEEPAGLCLHILQLRKFS